MLDFWANGIALTSEVKELGFWSVPSSVVLALWVSDIAISSGILLVFFGVKGVEDRIKGEH